MSIALLLLTLLFPPQTPTTSLPAPSFTELVPRAVTVIPPAPVVARLPKKLPGYTVTATVYSADVRQTDSEPLITADNSRISRHHSIRHRWMALSRDMLKRWGGKFEFGDSVVVSGISPTLDGTYVIHDTMNRRLHRTIDLLVGRHEDIYGKWDKVRISKLPPVWRAS